jgi:acylglycerol lipase
MRRRNLISLGLLAATGLVALGACAPVVQGALTPQAGFGGARLEDDAFVSFDGARLGLTRWEAEGEPWAVIVALHGMNDYANAFNLAAPEWAEAGIATYAIDQRGFGRSPGRGVWAGEALMTEDLRALCQVLRGRHPGAILAVVGESMGGAVAMTAFASDRPPDADRLVLIAPAVWGWSSQPLPYKTTLWFAARVVGSRVLQPPSFVTRKVRASDNIEELRRMGRDKLMIWGARVDALYGLVALMERGYQAPPRLRLPTAYLYGAKDQIIPEGPTAQAVARLRPAARTAYYEAGWHLLLRDHQRSAVIGDIAAFLRDARAPWPSGAPPIPTQPRPKARQA